VPGAIASYREAIRHEPGHAEAHCNLGNALFARGDLPGAEAAYRRAIRHEPGHAKAHCNLGDALFARGDLPGAEAAFRRAIACEPGYAQGHYGLGNALRDKGDLAGARAAFRKAIRHKPEFAEAHCNLGHVLRRQGELRKALAALRQGHTLGSRKARWAYPSGQWVRHCERLVELDGQLPGFLEGKSTASPAERIELARLCSLKGLNRAAVRFYEEAFAGPRLAEAPGASHRYNAACAAALAGCGKGKDADKLEDNECVRLRRLALNWLRADLEAWGRLLDREADKAGTAARVAKGLQHWLVDLDFAGVRGPEALAKLPEDERQPWRKLWDDVSATLARAQGKRTPAKKSDTR
jgi:Flp pilus assembly protein TadD